MSVTDVYDRAHKEDSSSSERCQARIRASIPSEAQVIGTARGSRTPVLALRFPPEPDSRLVIQERDEDVSAECPVFLATERTVAH